MSTTNSDLQLDPTQDYVLQCPQSPVELTTPLTISGGHNLVLENCDLDMTEVNWVMELRDQTGTMWIHDVQLAGANLPGGIQMQEPGATVVMRDVFFDEVHGSHTTNHAELIQTWAGPQRLLIDGLTGSTDYQGLYLLPNQYDGGSAPQVIDLRNIDIDDTTGAYALWLGDVTGAPSDDAGAGIGTWNVENVYVDPNPQRTWSGWWLWPQPSTPDPTWNNVIAGTPPHGSYVQPTSNGATGVDEGASPTALPGEQADP